MKKRMRIWTFPAKAQHQQVRSVDMEKWAMHYCILRIYSKECSTTPKERTCISSGQRQHSGSCSRVSLKLITKMLSSCGQCFTIDSNVSNFLVNREYGVVFVLLVLIQLSQFYQTFSSEIRSLRENKFTSPLSGLRQMFGSPQFASVYLFCSAPAIVVHLLWTQLLSKGRPPKMIEIQI